MMTAAGEGSDRPVGQSAGPLRSDFRTAGAFNDRFEPGDRVQDVCWDGAYAGTVRRVDADGEVFVRWDHHWAEYQMSPNQIVKLTPSGVGP